MPTGWQTFQDTMLFYGDATRHTPSFFSLPLFIWREASEAAQGQVVESIAAVAAPAGMTVRAVYEALRDRLLDDLAKAMPVDMVLLSIMSRRLVRSRRISPLSLTANFPPRTGREIPVRLHELRRYPYPTDGGRFSTALYGMIDTREHLSRSVP